MKNNSKKLKVCFITPFFYPVIGGVESHILNKSNELIKLGYDIEVFTSDMDREGRVKERPTNLGKIKIKRFRSWLKVSFGEIIFPGVYWAVKNSDADIFHVHSYRHLHNLVTLFTKKPCFLTPHWPIYKGQRPKHLQLIVDFIDKFFGKFILNKFTKVCAVTGLEIDWIKTFGIKEKDILLTPNALPIEYFKKYNGEKFRKKHNLKDELVVLSVSRIHKSKGTDQLVEVAKYFPKVKFMIVGRDGGFQEELELLAKDLNLKNIIFVGEVSEKEKMESYAAADIFCSPSHYEGFCISILEAMSQGCAVITSNQGGMPWVVGKEGLIFKDYNLNDLKNKLGKLIKNKKLRTNFGIVGKKKVKEFKWEKVAKILDKEYKKLSKG